MENWTYFYIRVNSLTHSSLLSGSCLSSWLHHSSLCHLHAKLQTFWTWWVFPVSQISIHVYSLFFLLLILSSPPSLSSSSLFYLTVILFPLPFLLPPPLLLYPSFFIFNAQHDSPWHLPRTMLEVLLLFYSPWHLP